MNSMTLQACFTNKKILIPLVLILILGSLLRFYALENQSLWHDELSSYNVINSESLPDVFYKAIHWEKKIPGYFAVLYFFTRYLGDSESTLRLPSAISGVLSIFAMFLLGLRLFSHREGLIASALVAVLWCPIYYSQEARPYSTLLLFTMLSMYFWISIVGLSHETSSVSRFASLGYIVTAIVSCYLHYYGLYLVSLQAVATTLVFSRRPKTLGSVLPLYVPIVIAVLPWLPTMWKHYNSGAFSFIEPLTASYFSRYLRFLFNFSGALLLLIVILYSSLGLCLMYAVTRQKKHDEAGQKLLSPQLLLVVLWLVLPYGAMHLTSLVVAPLVHFRYLIISLPAAYLLVSRSITVLPVRPWMQAVVGTLLIGLCLYHLVFVKDYYSKGQPGKAQFREAVAFVVKQEPLYEDSLIIGAVPSLDYYFDKNASARRVDAQGGSKWHDPDHKIAVTEMIRARNPKHLWFISEHESIDIDFVYFLDDHDFTLMLLKRFVGADVWLFRNDNKVDRLEKS